MNGMRSSKIAALLLLIGLTACSEKEQSPTVDEPVMGNEVITSSIMTIDHMMNSGAENCLIIDLRKQDSYLSGHIPGAVNVWRPQIQDSSYPYGGMRASREQLESLLAGLGANFGDTIVVYDDKGGVDALRLVWMLQYYSYSSTCLLDGGINAWNNSGNTLDTMIPEVNEGNFKLSGAVNESILAQKEDLIAALDSKDKIIVDARSTEEYSGKRQKKGAFRAGHIPGAIMIDFYHNIDYSSMKLKSANDLKAFYESHGLSPEKEILVYCQSGVRSAQTSFVLRELLKYPNVKNYDGSWIEWSYYSELPIESDTATSIYE